MVDAVPLVMEVLFRLLVRVVLLVAEERLVLLRREEGFLLVALGAAVLVLACVVLTDLIGGALRGVLVPEASLEVLVLEVVLTAVLPPTGALFWLEGSCLVVVDSGCLEALAGCLEVLRGCLPVALSGCLPVALSGCLPVVLSGCLPVVLSGCLVDKGCLLEGGPLEEALREVGGALAEVFLTMLTFLWFRDMP